jgi:hypothetical protein
MEDFITNDDGLRRLFHEEGLLTTSPGFTDKVMGIIESTPKTATEYAPLISRKAWWILASVMISLIAACLVALTNTKQESSAFTSLVQSTTHFVGKINFNPHFDPGTLMIPTLIIASITLLLVIDYFLNSRLKGSLK